MKVALIHDYLWEYGGAERVLELLHDMYPDAPVYTTFYFKEKMPKKFESWDIRTGFVQKIPFHRALRKPLIYLMPWVFENIDLRDYDIVISSSSFASKGVITHPETKHICYCYTPPRFVWGLSSRTRRNKLIKFFLGPFDHWLQLWDFAAAQRVDQFVAISEEVRDRIKKFYKKESVVIYPPITTLNKNEVTVKNYKDWKANDYYLVVSRLAQLKNIDLIIRSCLRQNRRLKIVGTGDAEKYLRSIADETIEFEGFVSEERLAELYENARGVIVAAEDEDFGLTTVEAASYGIPSIAFFGGGYKETVVEGINGHFFSELSNVCLDEAIMKFEEMEFESIKIMESIQNFRKEEFIKEVKKLTAL